MHIVNMEKTCRLCLYVGTKSEIVSIYKCPTADLPSRIKEFLSLEMDMKELNDRFPSVICISCFQTINNWMNFKNVCHETHNILLQSINNYSITNKISNGEDKSNINYVNNICEDLKIDIEILSPKSENFIPDIDNKNKIKVRKKSVSRLKQKFTRKKREENTKKENFNTTNLEESSDETLEEFLLRLEQENYEKEMRDFIYNCDICNKPFEEVFEYLDHQETHNGQPVFKCEKCTEVFCLRKDLVEHDARHQIPCPKCGKLILPSCMKVHLVLHTDKHKCTECNWRFCNNTTLRQHIDSVHIRLKTHVCETCGKSFTTTSSLQTHIKIHSDIRLYTCKICGYSGRTSSALYTHMARHENGLHVCEICAKSFKSYRSLRDHTRRVHSEKKNHECGVCHKKFVDKYMLTVHTRTHTGARPYVCNFCEKAFVRSDGLKEHMTTHGQRPSYNCDQCGKKFIYRRSLGRHTCIQIVN